nr:hypothetical protein [Bradyrhizobium elkanii]
MIRQRSVLMLPWEAVRLPGRSNKACINEFYKARLSQRIARAMHQKRRGRPPGPAVRPEPEPIETCSSSEQVLRPRARRQQDLGVLRDWADLRGRIAERGLTGGWFGDPPPGRSALDQRASEAADAVELPYKRGGMDGY